MALGTTWPQHNQQILELITAKKKKIQPNKKLILNKALNERVKRDYHKPSKTFKDSIKLLTSFGPIKLQIFLE